MAFSIATSLLVLSVATIQSAEPPTLSRVLPSAASLVRMAQAVPGIGDEDRVAITTFTNISGAPEDEWIGDGIVETLRADLTGIMHVLIVESRGRGTVEPTEGSGLVRARWVIRGGYQRLGDRVRITARVVEVVTSVVVQAARVDGAIGELFMLQDRLSAELRSGLMKESDPDFLIVPPGGETGTGSARPAVAPPSEGMASLLNEVRKEDRTVDLLKSRFPRAFRWKLANSPADEDELDQHLGKIADYCQDHGPVKVGASAIASAAIAILRDVSERYSASP